ncbi:MAG: alpha/beta hydrolase [Alphaproteobacteria bacterium]|nr:alpha/beta hydrolase [Alphaproteobacteria bacterium]
MKKIFALTLVLLWSFGGSGAADIKPFGIPRTQVVPVKDSGTGRQYELYIKLPAEYSENTDKTYPVIYMTDGDVEMDLLSGTTEFLMPNAILVGISWQKDEEGNAVRGSRTRDFTLFEYETIDGPTGEASNYLSFLRNDIIRYVENTFRTKPDERAFLGYSSAAEFGAYVLLAQPDTFKYYLLGSPALDKLSTQYLDELEVETAQQAQPFNVHVFLSTAENERPGRLELTEKLVSVLERRSGAGLSLAGLKIIKDAGHVTAVPETFGRAIKWLSQQIGE